MNMFNEKFYDKIVLLIRDENRNITRIEYEMANITFSGNFIIVNKLDLKEAIIESTPYNLNYIDKYRIY